MNFSALSPTQIGTIIAIVLMIAASIAIVLSLRKRRTERLRTQFGGAEYSRSVT